MTYRLVGFVGLIIKWTTYEAGVHVYTSSVLTRVFMFLEATFTGMPATSISINMLLVVFRIYIEIVSQGMIDATAMYT